MNYKKSIFRYIPKKAVDQLGQLDHTGMRVEYFYHVIYYIVSIQQFQKKGCDPNPFRYINIERLKTETTTRIRKYIYFLEKNNILESQDYVIGVKAKKYRVNHALFGEIVRVDLGTVLVDKIISDKESSKKRLSRLKPYLKSMYKDLKAIDCDFDSMKAYSIDNYEGAKLIYALNSIERLQDKRTRYFKISKVNGRLNTNLTNLPRELRSFIRGPFIEIDQKNSHFFFLAILLIKGTAPFNSVSSRDVVVRRDYSKTFNFKNKSVSHVLKRIERYSKKGTKHEKHQKCPLFRFLEITQDGTLYNVILEHMNLGLESRDRIKVESLGAIYSENEKAGGDVDYRKMKKALSELFPEVYDLVYEVKRKNYKELATALTSLESQLFIHEISPQLIEKGIKVYSIHDAFLVPSERANEVLKIMETTFESQTGFIPNFKIK